MLLLGSSPIGVPCLISHDVTMVVALWDSVTEDFKAGENIFTSKEIVKNKLRMKRKIALNIFPLIGHYVVQVPTKQHPR